MSLSEPSAAAWREIAATIETRTGTPVTIEHERAAAGGCINGARIFEGGGLRLFVKFNDAACAPMFAAEADALVRLATAGAIRVPRPLCGGVARDHAWLALEFFELSRAGQDWQRFGRELAALHRVRGERFGWHRDNTIGSTPQCNGWMTDWVEFLRERRLGYQLALAAANGHRGKLASLGKELLDTLERFFGNYRPLPSLLHGDLWSGNAGFIAGGQPVIFDPASYFGDREADLAMTELFGGFPADFYSAYARAWPLDPGYRLRKGIYNLYHLLNHLNLFGAGYLTRCEDALEALLR